MNSLKAFSMSCWYKCDNAYNTRCTSFVGLPVGPISNPGIESIEGTINYKEHNYYYFVADCSGKTYLNKDITGHYNTISKLKNDNKSAEQTLADIVAPPERKRGKN